MVITSVPSGGACRGVVSVSFIRCVSLSVAVLSSTVPGVSSSDLGLVSPVSGTIPVVAGVVDVGCWLML